MNCAAIPDELIESELFGHVKGSFTGAIANRMGKFEQADGGTLFLDEIGDMSLAAQAKVLRVLQEGKLEKVGGNETRLVDVRVIAATNKDLLAEARENRFREDLFYRLNVVPIPAPPLREPRDDISMLTEYFLERVSESLGCAPRRCRRRRSTRGAARLAGNVRELRNLVERMMIMTRTDRIEVGDVPSRPLPSAPIPTTSSDTLDVQEFKDDAERRFLERKLAENDGNVSRTARTWRCSAAISTRRSRSTTSNARRIEGSLGERRRVPSAAGALWGSRHRRRRHGSGLDRPCRHAHDGDTGGDRLHHGAPPPTTASSPRLRFCNTQDPIPMCARGPTRTPPARRAPGATCTKSPMSQSWSMLAAVFTMTPRPSRVPELTIAPAMSTVPAPS